MAHHFEWRYAFISLFLGGLLVAYLFSFLQSIFAANEVSITEDTTLVLPSDDSEYTLASGAQFDSLTINNDGFEFIMSSGGTATLSSSARRVFVTGDIAKSTTCSTNTSSIVVELDSGDSNGKKIFIRPSSETCPGSGGSVSTNSGGSGSSGGTGTTGSAPAAPAVPSQVEQQVTETPSLPVLPSGQTISALFSVSVGLSMTHSDIQRLQQLLNTDPDTRIADSGIGSPGNETNFFGSLTEKAVQKFQKKYGVALEGDPGFGFVGPKTRAKLQEVFGGIVPEVSDSQSIEVPSSSSANDTAAVQAQIDAAQTQLNLLLQQLEALSQ